MIAGAAALLALVASCGSESTAPARSTPGHIAATDPRISWQGRVSGAPGVSFAWPHTGFTVRFEGTGLDAHLRDTPRPDETRETDRFVVIVDGEPRVFAATAGEAWYPLASGLPRGVHDVTLIKRTEAEVGTATLLALRLAPGGQLLDPPPRRERRLEAVGDSITAGYGIGGAGPECHWSADTEDATATWVAHAARLLDAELEVVAWSGRGVSRNYDVRDRETIPDLYASVIPENAAGGTVRWPADPVADAVVINLGTNDFQRGIPDRDAFVSAYRRLIGEVRRRHPSALLVIALGPMLADDYPPVAPRALSTARAWLQEIVSDRRAVDDPGVELLELYGAMPDERLGCDYHPGARMHRRMGEQLATTIRTRLGW